MARTAGAASVTQTARPASTARSRPVPTPRERYWSGPRARRAVSRFDFRPPAAARPRARSRRKPSSATTTTSGADEATWSAAITHEVLPAPAGPHTLGPVLRDVGAGLRVLVPGLDQDPSIGAGPGQPESA